MTRKKFCDVLYRSGWPRCRDGDTANVSRCRIGFVLEKDRDGNRYFDGTDARLDDVELI